MRTLPLIVTALALGACSWGIKLDAGGRNVHVAWYDDVSACKPLGTITVSVLAKVGPMDRKQRKVRDELTVMARNEAATLGADTVRPLAEPANGEQQWQAYACGRAIQPGRAAPREKASDAAETFPLDQN